MNSYQVGDLVRITGTFTNTAGALTDPTTAVINVKRRDGPTSTYTYPTTITRASVGVFYADHQITAEGNYDYRVVGTGAVTAAGEGTFIVPDSQFF